ncbi:Plug domain-containing protein, partial [bacterium]
MDPRNAKYGASRARRRVAAAVAAAIGCGSMAASVAATPAVEGDGLEEVQITGSRIVRRDLEAPTPVVTVERETFTNSAFTSVEQVLLELPQFVAGGISGGNAGLAGEFLNNDVQPTATNTPGSATVNLRGLGANRSLTLIDGRRGQPSNASLTIADEGIVFRSIVSDAFDGWPRRPSISV